MAGPPHLILVHGDCADGFTSAGLLRRRLPHAEVVYTHPSRLREELEEQLIRKSPALVVLADLSPQAGDLPNLLRIVREHKTRTDFVWIDHHAPQWPPEFEKDLRTLGVEVLLDREQKESGASLSAQWAREHDPALLRVADLIRRRDAWTDPHDPDARAWTLVAQTYGGDYVQRLAEGRLDGLEAEGKRLLAEKERSIEASLAQVQRHSDAVRFLWSEDDISDVADRLFQRDAASVLLLRFGPSGRVSIRSRSERPIAAKLAQTFGGGGHANAAGFTLRLGLFHRLMYRMRKWDDPLVAQVLQTAQANAA